MKNKKIIFELVIFSMLCALAYVGVYIQIPLPTGNMVHLGNFICILAALLLGGVKGGFVGSIGMGLWDFFNGYPIYGVIQTIILKFLMGLVCGLIFTLLRKGKTNKCFNLSLLFGLSGAFFVVFIVFLVGYFKGGFVNNAGKVFPIHILIPISICIFALFFLVAGIFAIKKDRKYQRVLIATTVATLVNIVNGIVSNVIIFMTIAETKKAFVPALIDSVVKTPASFFTGIVTIIGACVVFPLLNRALEGKLSNLEIEE